MASLTYFTLHQHDVLCTLLSMQLLTIYAAMIFFFISVPNLNGFNKTSCEASGIVLITPVMPRKASLWNFSFYTTELQNFNLLIFIFFHFSKILNLC